MVEALFIFISLKGPKHQIFVAGIFTQIRPVCVDSGTRPKFIVEAFYSPLSATFFERCRQKRLKITKLRFGSETHKLFELFGLVPK